jgi:hypothetical protein
MEINWKLDESDGIDLDDLLGEIQISDNHGNLIEDNCIYLDTFFFTLSECLVLSMKQGLYRVDTIDEPLALVSKRSKNELSLEYGEQKVITTYKAAVSNFIESYNQLLSYLKSLWVNGKYAELEANIEVLKNEAL